MMHRDPNNYNTMRRDSAAQYPTVPHHTALVEYQIHHSVLLILLLTLVLYSIPVLAEPAPIVGRWQLDEAQSDNAADELRGIRAAKHKRHFKVGSKRPHTDGSTQLRYWEEANGGRDWHHTPKLAHTGPLQRLLESENLEIVPHGDGFLFVYADSYERSVVPNPGGRIFTASGEELVVDEIGYTLAYWDDASLILETRIKGGGKLIERISTSADGARLTVSIEIDQRDWKWIVKLQRIFVRS